MRYFSENDEELERLNPQPWMVELLKCNPSYCSWGPHEDYMMVKNRNEPDFDEKRHRDGGWASRVIMPDWKSFEFELDDLNECVNFYFEIDRESKRCETCGGDGYHPDAKWVSDSWYEHSSPFVGETEDNRRVKDFLGAFSLSVPSGESLRKPSYPSPETLAKYGEEFRLFCEQMRVCKSWSKRITQDEVDKLWERGRLGKEKPTALAVNSETKGFGHDAINSWICIEARLKRMGIPKTCPTCEGHGHIFTEPSAHVTLVLWWLHPRKGCSRGIEIKRIEKSEVQEAKEFLKKAAARNAERFSKL